MHDKHIFTACMTCCSCLYGICNHPCRSLPPQYINPEQAELLSRKNVLNARSKPALVLSMSMEGQKNSGSPGLKRRLSKERLTVPKLDMQKEREDMLHSLERLGEEQQESNGSYTVETQSQTQSSVTENTPVLQRQDSQQGSPKLSKRMSTKMQAKVSMFEQAGSSGSPPPYPRHSTPINSPQVNGPNEPTSECSQLLLLYQLMALLSICGSSFDMWEGAIHLCVFV